MNKFKLVKNIILGKELYDVKITITNRCNAACKSCLTPSIKNKKDMSFDVFKKIVDGTESFHNNIRTMHLYSIGESTLHKDFQKFIEYAYEKLHNHKISLVLTTNGGIPLTNFDLSKLDLLIISFNGFNREKYEWATGLKWDCVLKNIRNYLNPINKKRIGGENEMHILNFCKEKTISHEIAELEGFGLRIRISDKIDNQCGKLYNDDQKRVPCDYVTNTFCFDSFGNCILCSHDFYSQYLYHHIQKNDLNFKTLLNLKKKDIENHKKNFFEGLCKDCNYNTLKKGKFRWFS
jgi:hypothetical protein